MGTQIFLGSIPLIARQDGSPVVGLKYRRSGGVMVTGVQYAGNGKGSGMLTAWKGAPSPIAPIRDSYTPAGEIKDQARLQSMADADFEANRLPTLELSFSVQALDPLHPADFKAGVVVDLSVYGSPVIPDGLQRLQAVSVSGSFGNRLITPEVNPYGG